MANSLDKEHAAFERLRPSLVKDEGRFAVLAGDTLLGVFDTFQDALSAGYKEQGLKPFLVKQINSVEVVANFSRNLLVA